MRERERVKRISITCRHLYNTGLVLLMMMQRCVAITREGPDGGDDKGCAHKRSLYESCNILAASHAFEANDGDSLPLSPSLSSLSWTVE